MNNKEKLQTKIKTIRFPEPLYNQLAEAARRSSKSFNTMAIECLTQASPVVVTEGDSISGLLFDIYNTLDDIGITEGATKQVVDIVEELEELMQKISEKYMMEGEPYGNSEDC